MSLGLHMSSADDIGLGLHMDYTCQDYTSYTDDMCDPTQ